MLMKCVLVVEIRQQKSMKFISFNRNILQYCPTTLQIHGNYMSMSMKIHPGEGGNNNKKKKIQLPCLNYNI